MSLSSSRLPDYHASERVPQHAITLLGSFSVTVDGRPVVVPPGKPSLLVKRLALAQRLLAEEAIELLWPEADPSIGRKRLRNLLNRLRTTAGDLVRREADMLALTPGTQVDALLFDQAAVEALAAEGATRASLAQLALGRYAGELMPEDRYEEWSVRDRERLRRRHLELLDVLVEEAIDRDSVDEAIRLLDRAMEEEPLDEDRYLRAAELLLRQGRRGGARGIVERAAAVRESLGLPAGPRLVRLMRATGMEPVYDLRGAVGRPLDGARPSFGLW